MGVCRALLGELPGLTAHRSPEAAEGAGRGDGGAEEGGEGGKGGGAEAKAQEAGRKGKAGRRKGKGKGELPDGFPPRLACGICQKPLVDAVRLSAPF